MAWAALILVLTSIPIPQTVAGAAPGGTDKLVHFGLYAVLGYLVTGAVWRPDAPWRSVGLALAGIAVFAAADELHQLFVPGRHASALDWLADVAGAVTGAIAAMLRSSSPQWSE